jgi:hypothetical protein
MKAIFADRIPHRAWARDSRKALSGGTKGCVKAGPEVFDRLNAATPASVGARPNTANGALMEYKQALAYPLLRYQILKNPEQPTIAAIAFETEVGPSLFAATREILEELAEAFQRQASKMPRKKDQN